MKAHPIIEYPKSQYKKFIKDVVSGTLERTDLIEETILKHLDKDINLKKTDKLLKIILFAAIFELMFKHNTPKKYVFSKMLFCIRPARSRSAFWWSLLTDEPPKI